MTRVLLALLLLLATGCATNGAYVEDYRMKAEFNNKAWQDATFKYVSAGKYGTIRVTALSTETQYIRIPPNGEDIYFTVEFLGSRGNVLRLPPVPTSPTGGTIVLDIQEQKAQSTVWIRADP